MKHQGTPARQGLYDPQFEHDACGVGFVANIKGRKSHDIVSQALTVLRNLDHRGACCEVNTGDGAGILMQMPDKFLRKVAAKRRFHLPEPGHYGVGMIFCSTDLGEREASRRVFEQIAAGEGQKVIGWRDVPTNPGPLGVSARASMPFVRQVFIARSPECKDAAEFERKLYMIRKRAHNEIRKGSLDHNWYVASLSHRTIVYKGMLMPEQVDIVYPDLRDEDFETAIALVHSRFSTNTFPSWERAHPYRYLAHNGEINTLRGNVNWMRARQPLCQSELFGPDLEKTYPIINENGSDSQMFDNCLEFLVLGGRSLPHTMMMMVPEPWENHESMDEQRRAFYQYHAALMEAWDGPAALAFTDGVRIGACLDRNGLRPARYYITADDRVILASEAGVLPVEPANVVSKGRLQPGRMFLIDTEQGRLVSDEEVKATVAGAHPYAKWVEQFQVDLDKLAEPKAAPAVDHTSLTVRQKAFGYTYEDLEVIIGPMAKTGVQPIGAMGNDAPLAILSEKPQLLFNYFKQLFAQVTNPPIDSIREEVITSSEVTIGPEGNLLDPQPESCRAIRLHGPVLTNEQLERLRHAKLPGFASVTLPTLFKASAGAKGLRDALDALFASADRAIDRGANILVLSDRGVDHDNAGIPSLLAVAGLHHHLIRQGTRMRVGLVLESGEPRDVHHVALLVGYGCVAINPYLAFETIADMIGKGTLPDISYQKAVKNFEKAVVKGVVKTMAKMGISTIQSYSGAQIFEAIGINQRVVDEFFAGTPTRLEGIGLSLIAEETLIRHRAAFSGHGNDEPALDSGGDYKWRKDGEYHLFNPDTIHALQKACRTGDYNEFRHFSNLINHQEKNLCTLRGLLGFRHVNKPVPLDEVESVESLVKRFKTGAMSYGSISQEAHECMAIAMNRLGAKSNTGEGGEDPARFTWTNERGDSKCSAIKQVASGRFGVTINYLVNAVEIQIKMAQGAKPGEGGELPGGKVYPWVAKTRHSTPGVGLISPPPHHDIYSIEDLAELIHDLKNANRNARISVKLVSEVGVGTIAAGVAKAHADVVLISGYDGGTGASPLSSIKHAGIPWELGLAETHQTLVLNNLRSRIRVETDGQLRTGRDVAIATLLGAEEFGFATAPLVAMGCIMMRVCHLNTCPVGVATQDPELRKRFIGAADNVVNFMVFVATELREVMAELGFRKLDDMVGRTDLLESRAAHSHWKAKGIDFSRLLYQPLVDEEVGTYQTLEQDHGIDRSLDVTKLLDICKPAIERGEKVRAELPITNINRVVGTVVGSDIAKKHPQGLPEDTVRLKFKGNAGQSFGAFTPKGMTLEIEGDANDYVGKGLSGGRIVIYPPAGSAFKPAENIIIGNVALFGATSGELFISGMAGERFAVRNSGATAVTDSVGDHGCEYMTGGCVVILGPTGRNFAAGMSGGVAYVLDEDGTFATRVNAETVALEPLEDAKEREEVLGLIKRQAELTRSENAFRVIAQWEKMLPKFVKVMPKDYKRMLAAIKKATDEGLSGDDALIAAFEANTKGAK